MNETNEECTVSSEMSGGPGFGSTFDDLIHPFFGRAPFEGVAPRRSIQRVDVSKLLAEQARELVQRAAGHAVDWACPNLDTEHPLWAATQLPGSRQVLEQAGDKGGVRLTLFHRTEVRACRK
jgi:ATP-dependent Clp protease ATP-binding subunit ClpC